MRLTTPPSPHSSSVSAPVIVLRPKPSRLLLVWWLALHALLVAAAVLVGWPWPAKVVAILGAVWHGLRRWPAATPTLILVAADGSCRIPARGEHEFALGPRTRLTPHWMLLSLHGAGGRVDLLLLTDQLDHVSWARLCARVRSARAQGSEPDRPA